MSIFGHGSKESEFKQQLEFLKKVWKYFVLVIGLLLILLFLSTMVTQVKVQETGVLKRFGKVVRKRVEPGICIKFPWPIDRLDRVKTKSIRRARLGFGVDLSNLEAIEREQGATIDQIRYGLLMVPYVLTGDKNIINIKVVVTYSISDPEQYLYAVYDSESIMKQVAQSIILKDISQMTVDDVLTTGKLELRSNIHRQLAEKCRELRLGLDIQSVEIKNVRPPKSTLSAFKDVINAQEESNELVHQAEAYRNRVIPEARADAKKILEEAIAYKQRKIAYAKGEAKRFELLVAEFR